MKFKTTLLAMMALVFAFSGANAAFPDTERFYEFSLQLTGKIGGKYAIDMLLSTRMSDQAPFLAKSGECMEVEGWYAYHTQIKPINLSGKFCPQNGGLMLAVKDGSDEKERFSGKYIAANGLFSGDWHMTANNKTLAFELKHVPASASSKAWFMADLKEQYQGDAPSMESFSVADMGMDQGGCYIENLQYGWNGYLDHFCGTRLEISTDYNSTYRATSAYYNYQLLPGQKPVALAWIIDSNYIKEEEEQDESSEGYSFSVFGMDGDEVKDAFPAGFPQSKTISGSDGGVSIHVLHDRFSLDCEGKNWKLVWDGSRFVEGK